jgi:hypothetical protein
MRPRCSSRFLFVGGVSLLCTACVVDVTAPSPTRLAQHNRHPYLGHQGVAQQRREVVAVVVGQPKVAVERAVRQLVFVRGVEGFV